METVREFTYFGDSVCGACEAAVSARTRCGWVEHRKCRELLYDSRFLLRLRGTVCGSYVRPAVLCGSEAWCLKEIKMRTLQRTKRSMMRTICGVQLNDIKRSTCLMLMLGLNESIDQFAMANSVHWYGHVLGREDGDVLRIALDFMVECQRKKWGPRRTWKKQVEEEGVKVGLRREDALCRSKWSVGVDQIAAGLRRIWPPSLILDDARFLTLVSLSLSILDLLLL